jgi:predicted nucleotidyltransferase
MRAERFKLMISDFVERGSKIENVISMILFGSAARDEMNRGSDIDILVLVDEPEPGSMEELKRIEREVESHGFNLELVIMTPEEFKTADKNFMENIIRDGILLFGKPIQLKALDLELHPYVIFIYSLKELRNPDKMRLYRALYGRKTTKAVGKIEYVSESEGFISQGAKPSRNVIMFPEDKAREVRQTFERFGVRYTEIKAFLPVEEFEKFRR